MALLPNSDEAARKPLLSTIVPAVKADTELRRCIDSIRLACGSDENRCEVILVMPPDSLEEAKRLVPGVSLFVAESRRGIYSAMNDGIRASSGRYLFFLGKDDIVLPPFGAMLDGLERKGGSAAFCDVYWGKEGLYSGSPSKWKVLYRNFCHQGIIYSRAVIERHGPYLRRMRVQADHLLNIRLLWDARFAPDIHYFSGGLVWYAAEGYSSVARDPLFWRLYPTIVKRYVGHFASWLLSLSRKLRGK
jgi:glycosyltransferase involved in cell wall biosynthesis